MPYKPQSTKSHTNQCCNIFASQGFSVHFAPHKLCSPFMRSKVDRKPLASQDSAAKNHFSDRVSGWFLIREGIIQRFKNGRSSDSSRVFYDAVTTQRHLFSPQWDILEHLRTPSDGAHFEHAQNARCGSAF
uniref:Uncharacterized protein n=1 Tax=Magallana gigas TaxID=29159 RepID=K1QUR1_MAGGI